MADRGTGCWESHLSGSERARGAALARDKILWRRRETRRQTEKTNLRPWKSPVYSKPLSDFLCFRHYADLRKSFKSIQRQKTKRDPFLRARRERADDGFAHIDCGYHRKFIGHEVFFYGTTQSVYLSYTLKNFLQNYCTVLGHNLSSEFYLSRRQIRH